MSVLSKTYLKTFGQCPKVGEGLGFDFDQKFYYHEYMYHLGYLIPGEQSKETILILYIPSLKACNDSRYSIVETVDSRGVKKKY